MRLFHICFIVAFSFGSSIVSIFTSRGDYKNKAVSIFDRISLTLMRVCSISTFIASAILLYSEFIAD